MLPSGLVLSRTELCMATEDTLVSLPATLSLTSIGETDVSDRSTFEGTSVGDFWQIVASLFSAKQVFFRGVVCVLMSSGEFSLFSSLWVSLVTTF